MDNGYVTFLKFDDATALEPYTDVLIQNNIDFKVEDQSYSTDPIIQTPGGNVHDFRIKLLPADFDKANALLENVFAAELEGIEPDYFLFDFTEEELMDVVRKPDEWGHLNYALAKKLLAGKGKVIDTTQKESFEKERIAELSKTEKSSGMWIAIAYLCAVLGLLVIYLGAVGIFIGLMLSTFKKTLPNGQRVFVYDEDNRKHGKRIFAIALVTTIITIVLRYVAMISVLAY